MSLSRACKIVFFIGFCLLKCSSFSVRMRRSQFSLFDEYGVTIGKNTALNHRPEHSLKLATPSDGDIRASSPVLLTPFKTNTPREHEGQSSVSTLTFNLAKSIVGSGILSLPAGVTAFSNSPSAVYPATVSSIVMGLMSAYGFSAIGRACSIHGANNFGEAWRMSTNSHSNAFISFVIAFKTLVSCLCYSMIIGDSFSQILSPYFVGSSLVSRNNIIYLLTSTILLPLCLLTKLDALKYSSILGLGGTIYSAVFVAMRYFDGSYTLTKPFYHEIAANFRPIFGNKLSFNMGFFQFLAMASSAYVAHYNAPKIWTELKEPSKQRYNTIVMLAFTIAAVLYISLMIFGYLTFGASSNGLILNNYAHNDAWAVLARFATGLGVLCGYPLSFFALRDNIFELFGQNDANSRAKLHVPVTLGLLLTITAAASMLRNVGIVVSMSGALVGTLLIFILPAIMNIYNDRRGADWTNPLNDGKGDVTTTAANHASSPFRHSFDVAMLCTGIGIAVLGLINSLSKLMSS